VHLAGCSSLASHDRQRRKMEVQPGRVAVGSLWKPSWERTVVKGRSGGCIRVDAGRQQPSGDFRDKKTRFKVVVWREGCVLLVYLPEIC